MQLYLKKLMVVSLMSSFCSAMDQGENLLGNVPDDLVKEIIYKTETAGLKALLGADKRLRRLIIAQAERQDATENIRNLRNKSKRLKMLAPDFNSASEGLEPHQLFEIENNLYLSSSDNARWSPNGQYLAIAGYDLVIRSQNAPPKLLPNVKRYRKSFDFAWSPDSTKIAFYSGNRLCIVSLATESIVELKGHSDDIRALSWNPDCEYLASGSDDKTVRIWNTFTGRCEITLYDHSDWVTDVQWSPDGNYLASCSHAKTASICSVREGFKRTPLLGHTGPLITVRWSHDGMYLATAGSDVRIWTKEGNCCAVLNHGEGDRKIRALAWHPLSYYLITADFRTLETHNEMKVWSIPSGTCLETLEGHTKPITKIQWNADGSLWAAQSQSAISLWKSGIFKHL